MSATVETYRAARVAFEALQKDLALVAHGLREASRGLCTDPIRFRDSLVFRQLRTPQEVEAMLGPYEAAYRAMTDAWCALSREDRQQVEPLLDANLMQHAAAGLNVTTKLTAALDPKA